MQTTTERHRVGLIAGVGLYPLHVAKLLKEKNYEVYCAGIRDHAMPGIAAHCAGYQTMGMGQFGKAMRFFKKNKISIATMAGGVRKQLLFSKNFLWNHFPDFYTARLLAHYVLSRKKSHCNDSLLLRCVDAFELQGIHIVSATDMVPELIMKHTVITKRRPSTKEWKDIQYGWKIAREMGRFDIGQSVAVKNQSIIAVEALEGTDACIRRAGTLCAAGGYSFIKIGKPNQDMRFDVPFFGMETLRTLAESGASILAMEADKTISVEVQACADYANKNNLSIIFIDDDTLQKDDLPGDYGREPQVAKPPFVAPTSSRP